MTLLRCTTVLNRLCYNIIFILKYNQRIYIKYKDSTMAVQKCLTGLNSRLAIVLGAQWGD